MEKALIIVGAIMVIAGMVISILIVESILNTHIAVFPIVCLVMITGLALIRITLFYSAKNKQSG